MKRSTPAWQEDTSTDISTWIGPGRCLGWDKHHSPLGPAGSMGQRAAQVLLQVTRKALLKVQLGVVPRRCLSPGSGVPPESTSASRSEGSHGRACDPRREALARAQDHREGMEHVMVHA